MQTGAQTDATEHHSAFAAYGKIIQRKDLSFTVGLLYFLYLFLFFSFFANVHLCRLLVLFVRYIQ